MKLNLYSNNGITNWIFLENNINFLESFEMKIKENNNFFSIRNLVFTLNKMTKLKHLKLSGCLKLNQFKFFNENNNLDYLDIDFIDLDKNINETMTDFLKNFKNLKSLIFYGNEYVELNNIIFPKSLNHIELFNFKGKYLISLLNNNKENLYDIEEFKIEMIIFDEYSELIELLDSIKFKRIRKFSLNKIFFKYPYSELFNFEKISLFLNNNPSLIELDISSNNHCPKHFKDNLYEIIKSSIPKKLLNFKIFNN